MSLDGDILVKRSQAIYTIDERSVYRKSHENPEIVTLYSEFLTRPGMTIDMESIVMNTDVIKCLDRTDDDCGEEIILEGDGWRGTQITQNRARE